MQTVHCKRSLSPDDFCNSEEHQQFKRKKSIQLWDSLPREVLGKIFEFCIHMRYDNFWDANSIFSLFTKFSLVCKNWKHLIDSTNFRAYFISIHDIYLAHQNPRISKNILVAYKDKLHGVGFRYREDLFNLMLTCHQLNHLKILELHENPFKLSSNIKNFTQLKSLNLQNAAIDLPIELENLTQLEKLDVSMVMPPHKVDFSRLKSLKKINFSAFPYDPFNDNILPKSVNHLSHLTSLTCRMEFFDGEQLSSLINLRKLKVGIHQDSEIPKNLQDLKHLEILEIIKTNISLESIGLLTNLRSLRFFRCTIPSIPSSLGQLTKLKSLSLDLTSLQMPKFPKECGRLISLKYLRFSGYGLPILPETLQNIKELKDIIVDDRFQFEKLPDWIDKTPNLNIHYL